MYSIGILLDRLKKILILASVKLIFVRYYTIDFTNLVHVEELLV